MSILLVLNWPLFLAVMGTFDPLRIAKDRHGWRGYVINYRVRATRDDIRSFCKLDSLRRLGNTFHIWRTVRPDRDLF